jgi:adenosylhomocysteinase
MVCNSGHFDVELDLVALDKLTKEKVPDVRREVDEYKLKNGKRLYVIGSGRLVNLAAAEGHPPSVMDMSFATQALATEYCVKNKGKLTAAVHEVPIEVERYVSREKLASMGITIDSLTKDQESYLSGWEHGT